MTTAFLGDKPWVDPKLAVALASNGIAPIDSNAVDMGDIMLNPDNKSGNVDAVLMGSFFRTRPVNTPNAFFTRNLGNPAVGEDARDLPEGKKLSNPKDAMGIKKAPMSTVSALVLAEIGVGMLEGALNYGRHNYRVVGVLASIYYDATMRHLRSWWEGEDIDPKSQLNHVTKAITSLIVLRDAMIMNMYTDDRPPAMPNVGKFLADLDAHAAMLIERDGHLKPTHYTEKNKGG